MSLPRPHQQGRESVVEKRALKNSVACSLLIRFATACQKCARPCFPPLLYGTPLHVGCVASRLRVDSTFSSTVVSRPRSFRSCLRPPKAWRNTRLRENPLTKNENCLPHDVNVVSEPLTSNIMGMSSFRIPDMFTEMRDVSTAANRGRPTRQHRLSHGYDAAPHICRNKLQYLAHTTILSSSLSLSLSLSYILYHDAVGV